MKRVPIRTVYFILFLPIFATSAYTQTIWVVKKLNGSIKFDGIPNESAWQEIPLFSFIVQQPSYWGVPG